MESLSSSVWKGEKELRYLCSFNINVSDLHVMFVLSPDLLVERPNICYRLCRDAARIQAPDSTSATPRAVVLITHQDHHEVPRRRSQSTR